MKRITHFATAFFMGLVGAKAQTSSCSDAVAYVNSKNVGSVGSFHLSIGHEEKAAQTYYYSGPGKINSIRVYGSLGSAGGVTLRAHVYAVDQLGRPKQELSYADGYFWYSDNSKGYISINLPDGGTFINQNFAIGITLLSSWPYGTEFQLAYTGDGEGLGQDLASVAGTSTGNNWTSAVDNFDKDGDFYLIPEITHFITPVISAPTHCFSVGSPIEFTNESAFTKDSMFNRINDNGYTGSAKLYSWDFGDGSPISHTEHSNHTYVAAGAYTAKLTVAVEGWSGLCTNTYQFPLSVGLAASVSNIASLTCYGANNGSITSAASGGTPPYKYSIDGYHFQDLNTFGSLSAGVDTLVVKDALGCLKTTIYNVQQPSEIRFITSSSTNANCGSSNGALLVVASGGTGTLLYKLDGGNYQSSGNFLSLSGGTYSITVKDVNGCSKSTLNIVNNFGSPVLSLISKTDVSCNGSADGTIQVSASGGTGVHRFSINGGSTYQSGGIFTGLSAGTYSVIVKDATDCTQGMVVTINQPLPMSFTVSTVQATCAGISDAQLTVNAATGGIGSYTYSLGGTAYQSTPQFKGLASGQYSVYLRDAAGCVATNQITIAPTLPVVSSAVPAPVSCYGESTGSILITASGGNGSYIYSMNGDDFQNSPLFNGLAAGTYTYSVRDNRSCTVQSTVTISQLPKIEALITSTSATCGVNNGGILAVGSGGFGSGYSYSLDGTSFNTTGNFSALNAGTYFITVKDGASCKRIFTNPVADANGPVIESVGSTDVGCYDGNDATITVHAVSGGTGSLSYSINGQNWSAGTSFVGLRAGNYTVFVKDVNGCIGTTKVVIQQPSALMMTKTVTDVTCYDGSNGAVTVFAAGGSGTLAYSIDNGTTYQSSNAFHDLSAQMYKVTVRDIAGCTGSIFVTIHEPSQISFTTGVLNVTCHGDLNGAISVNSSGGTGNYQYNLVGNVFQSNNSFTGLAGGTYTLRVRDANSCISSQAIVVKEPDSLEIDASVFSVSCAGGNNGAIDITISGGSGSNSYSWSNGSTSQDLFDLTSGTYILEVKDKNRCSTSQSFTITDPDKPLVINAVVDGTNANSGSIDATVTGGTEPYGFDWSNGEKTEDISSLKPGAYILTVTDASGCISTGQFTVENTTGLNESFAADVQLNLFPNPTNHVLHVDWNKKQIGQLDITDVNGRKVYEARIGKSNLDLDVRMFEEGVYYLRVYNKDETAVSRFRVIK
jgi:hypothetical protein